MPRSKVTAEEKKRYQIKPTPCPKCISGDVAVYRPIARKNATSWRGEPAWRHSDEMLCWTKYPQNADHKVVMTLVKKRSKVMVYKDPQDRKLPLCVETCVGCGKKVNIHKVPGTVALPRGWQQIYITLYDWNEPGTQLSVDTRGRIPKDQSAFCTQCVKEIKAGFKRMLARTGTKMQVYKKP